MVGCGYRPYSPLLTAQAQPVVYELIASLQFRLGVGDNGLFQPYSACLPGVPEVQELVLCCEL
jgi:hypothetical protein